jgi:hypothetical protein
VGTTDTVIRYTVKPDVVARGVADEMILLDLETGTYFTLNSVGAAIWKHLENGTDRDGAIAAVVEQFEVDLETATADFDEYVTALTSEGLLVA